jgi:gamma-glutamylcyclotransferase (GGCT)/AIG2-like uncharacterized protein YtfP
VSTPLAEVIALIAAANRLRREQAASRSDATSAESAPERHLETLFQSSQRLAVYGSLAPGRSNHHVVAPLGGEWTAGVVVGDRVATGWGSTLGFPAFIPRADGPAVAVDVLTSGALPAAWPELDRFEGAEYERVLVAVFVAAPPGRSLYTVANLYAAAEATRDRIPH